MGKDISCTCKPKEKRVDTLTAEIIDIKLKTVTRLKEGHYIMIKGLIHQDDITIIRIYAPNIGVPAVLSKY